MRLPDKDTLHDIWAAWKYSNEYQTELAFASTTGSFLFWSSTEDSGNSYGSALMMNSYDGNNSIANGKGSSDERYVVLCVAN